MSNLIRDLLEFSRVESEGRSFVQTDKQIINNIRIDHELLISEKHEGSGIGLALCKKIVDNHHREIFAKSTEGKGTAFHVILPVERNSI